MAQAPRDQNYVPSGLLWNVSGAATVAWKADTATGRGIVTVADATPPTPTPSSANAKRDQNYVPAVMALVNGTTGTLVPLTCDSNGYIICTVNWE